MRIVGNAPSNDIYIYYIFIRILGLDMTFTKDIWMSLYIKVSKTLYSKNKNKKKKKEHTPFTIKTIYIIYFSYAMLCTRGIKYWETLSVNRAQQKEENFLQLRS